MRELRGHRAYSSTAVVSVLFDVCRGTGLTVGSRPVPVPGYCDINGVKCPGTGRGGLRLRSCFAPRFGPKLRELVVGGRMGWHRRLDNGRAFSYIVLLHDRGVEQLVARRAHNPKVAGSSPVPATGRASGRIRRLGVFSLPSCRARTQHH